ncbi:MAG: ribosomal subunit interface protein [Deltaproteobacteria bacterium RBG_13_53_10]|nr:MAG: ribosomal subunit interface protein [Deltaproteobacteria bacterium RBG_13_53_10]
MMITVTFRRMEPTESLRAYAEEKLSKIKKYLDSPMEAHAVLEVEKFRHMADVTVNVDGTRIKAYEETEDMYSAIDMVMDKIENQVKKHRARLRERKAENIKGELTLGSEAAEGIPDEPTISVEKLMAKPMDPEEAAMQLSTSRQDFLVFRNSRSREINVIYKRKDGNIGLIEPAS